MTPPQGSQINVSIQPGGVTVVRDVQQTIKINTFSGAAINVGGQSTAIHYREYPAAVAIGGHRVVALRAGQLVYASNLDVLDASLTIGVTDSATDAGELCRAYNNSVITDSSLTGSAGTDVYLGINGLISETPPTTGLFSLKIGCIIAPAQLWVSIDSPIFR
jgi:hypothetical protein